VTFPSIVIAAVLMIQGPSALSNVVAASLFADQTQTYQTVDVQKGTRLDLTNEAGEVVVKTWDRDAVRIHATHSSRSHVRISPQAQVLVVASTYQGIPTSVDYDISVPAWMDIRIDGQYCFVDITGVAGNVSIETMRGDIMLRGLGGIVSAKSVEGRISVDGGKGKITVSTAEDHIDVTNASGEISAESIDGDVKLTNVQASAVEISTVDGDIAFSGPLTSSGRYRFATHDGDITLEIPESTSATFGVRLYDSDGPHSSLPLKAVGEVRRGRRATYTLGTGAAQVEVESFDGSLHIRKTGEKR
jgi:DUF4097 and DUF4098 domain-containing protein YvlB